MCGQLQVFPIRCRGSLRRGGYESEDMVSRGWILPSYFHWSHTRLLTLILFVVAPGPAHWAFYTYMMSSSVFVQLHVGAFSVLYFHVLFRHY